MNPRPRQPTVFPRRRAHLIRTVIACLLFAGFPDTGLAAGRDAPVVIGNDSLLLFSVELDGSPVTDSLATYGVAEDPLIPLAELSRLLDLDVEVRPEDGAVTGRIGEAQRHLTLDLANAVARIGSRSVPIGPGDAVAGPNDIYLKAALLQELLPLSVVVNGDELVLQLRATEKLPLQARKERVARWTEQRLAGGISPAEEDQLRVETPYAMLGRPTFDFTAAIGGDSVRGQMSRRFEARMAGDLLKTTFNGFVGTDDRGRPSTARLQMYRRSAGGDLLGPIGATYAAGGDVFTPALPLGPRSVGGAGFVVSTAKQDDTSIFDRVTLRGELPLGFDVEIYVNDILRSGQSTPVQGRYEFVDVPLVRGVNVVRVVAYGPRGERQEQVRVINVGSGQLARGQVVLDAGVVAEDRSLVELSHSPDWSASKARGGARAVLGLAYGLTSGLTASAGLATYRSAVGRARTVGTAGLRTSLLGAALQMDLAHDFSGGQAASLGAAGRLGPFYFVGRHVEYRAGFEDENVPYFESGRPSRRFSQVMFDFGLPLPAVGALPVSLRAERSQFADGGVGWTARARTSLTVAETVTALGLDYSRRRRAGISTEQMSVNLSASRLVDYVWQLRASADYDVMPNSRLRGLAITADRDISDQFGLRFGIARSFGTFRDTTAQAGVSARLPFADLSLSSDYSPDQKRWRVGLQISLGAAFDPVRGGYRFTPPGPANGGSAVLRGFVDENGDGQFNDDEKPVPGIVLSGASRRSVTDARGIAFVTGLGEGLSARLRVDPAVFDSTFAVSPPKNVVLAPRAGTVAVIPYPLTPTAEVWFQLQMRKDDGSRIGVAAVRVQLVDEKGEALPASSEFDGVVAFEAVRPGKYRFRLEPEQAARLRMRLKEDVVVEVRAGVVNRSVELEFVKDA